MTEKLNLPSLPSSPMFIGEKKIMTIEWQEFFRAIYNRVGGTITFNLNEVLESVGIELCSTPKDWGNKILELEKRIETIPIPINWGNKILELEKRIETIPIPINWGNKILELEKRIEAMPIPINWGNLIEQLEKTIVSGLFEQLNIQQATGVLTLRPMMDSVSQLAHSKPTQVTRGVYKGYSFPIFIPGGNEQLFFREVVPGRWNGVSDINFCAYICLAAGENVGDYFQFRLAWEHAVSGSIIPVTFNDVDVEQIVLVGRNAQYDLYELVFIMDYDIDGVGNEIKPHELLSATFYRIDATNPDIGGEAILVDWHTTYKVNKIFKPL